MSTRIVGVILDDLARRIGIRRLDLADCDLVRVTFLLRVQRHAISTCLNERAQTSEHSGTVLKETGKCNPDTIFPKSCGCLMVPSMA